MGRLKKSITTADLAGTWQNGAGSVTSYYDSSSGNYSGTDTVFFGEVFNIRANGTFDYKFAGRANNHTVRETDSGTITLSGQFIIINYKVHAIERYQLIAFMVLPKGGAILTVVPVGRDMNGMNPQDLSLLCGHSKGYISCVNDTELSRLPAGKQSLAELKRSRFVNSRWAV